jgi:protein-disulfide isomerase
MFRKTLLATSLLTLFSCSAFAGESVDIPDGIKDILKNNYQITVDSAKFLTPTVKEMLVHNTQGVKDIGYLLDDRLLMVGNVIDLSNNKNLTRAAKNASLKIDGQAMIMSIAENKVVAFTVGKGDKKLFAFVDPICPHCEALMRLLKSDKLMDQYKMYVIPVALNSNPESKKLLSHFVKDDKLDLDHWMALSALKQVKLDEKNFPEGNMVVFDKFKMPGTPSIYDEQGNMIEVTDFLKQ